MKLALLFCLFCLINIIYSQDCGIVGPYTCTGGTILGMDFGDDDDDDFFEYFASFGNTQTDNSCTIVQQGTTSVDGNTITVEFEIDDDECVITGDASAGCNCLDSLSLTTSSNCVSVFGPNGEQCESSDECFDSFTCPGGETPQDNPNVEPTANGCGPSAFPIAGPSFSFLECCEQHDFCYSTCGASKLQCDNDFYECMFCSCGVEYEDDFFGEFACEELSCSYFQLVEEFGCPAFTSGQEGACICPSSKSESKIVEDNQPIPNKFGGISPSMRQTKLICDAPFSVSCPSTGSDDDETANDDGNDDNNNDDNNNDDNNNDDNNNDDDNNTTFTYSIIDDDDDNNTSDDNNDDNNNDDDDNNTTFTYSVIDDDDDNNTSDNNDDDDDNNDDDDGSKASLISITIVVAAVTLLLI